MQAQLQQQRYKRALHQSRDKTVDVQIGFTVFLDVPQEMRSRLWLVLIQEPALAVPFQVRLCLARLLGLLCLCIVQYFAIDPVSDCLCEYHSSNEAHAL